MREARVEEKLRKKVEAAGGFCLKYPGNLFAGFPDRILLLPGGRIVLVELKAPGRKPSPIQRLVHRKLAAIGFPVLVIDTLEKVEAFEI